MLWKGSWLDTTFPLIGGHDVLLDIALELFGSSVDPVGQHSREPNGLHPKKMRKGVEWSFRDPN